VLVIGSRVLAVALGSRGLLKDTHRGVSLLPGVAEWAVALALGLILTGKGCGLMG
jgi:hypothetical protein